MKKPARIHAARILLGSHPGQALSIYAHTAEEFGVPTVEIAGDIEAMWFMKPETALEVAEGLLNASMIAREREHLIGQGEIRKAPANDA